MELTDIKWLHVEATTKCNAWCPSCPRNLDGYGITPGLELRDLLLLDFQQTIDKLPNLDTIQFCGNYGDPVVAKRFLSMVRYAESKVNRIQIHTNGSIRTEKWWYELGKHLRYIDHEVIFAIDGIKGTNEIYRQGTDYDKIIKNASKFIEAGGNAVWQFIPFKHNEQEILFVMAESQRLGFKRFTVQQNVALSADPARHWRTGKEYKIEFWKNDELINLRKETSKVIQKHNCMHLDLKSLYLSAKGDLSPCCFLDNVVQYSGNTDIGDEVFSNPNYICLEKCGTKSLSSTKKR